jgi:DNA-binding PucR family transcriptional regulator
VRDVGRVSRSDEIEIQIRHFVGLSLEETALDRFVAVVDGVIKEAIPEIASDPVLAEDLNRSTRNQWIAFLNGLRQPEHGLVLPAQAQDLARSLARRSSDVKLLVRVYLNAHHGVFAYLTEAVDAMSGDLASEEVLREVWKRADLWMDDSIESLIEIFFEERQRELDGSATRRAELVMAILAGEDVDDARGMSELSYPLPGWHTSFLAWTSKVDERTGASLRLAADAVAKCFPASQLLTEMAGSRDLRGWVATRLAPTAEALEQLRSIDIPGVSVALGVPGEGQHGFRSSHADARAAQNLAMTSQNAPRFIEYRSVEILSLAMADRDALVRMVRREVGPLCGSDKNLEPVRETVLTFLTNRMNVEATAEKLHVHGNTVRYRLAKAEELLGCPLAERPRQIELALQYVAHFGAPD